MEEFLNYWVKCGLEFFQGSKYFLFDFSNMFDEIIFLKVNLEKIK